MSEASDLLAEGFAEFIEFTDSPTLTANGATIPCIAPAMDEEREQMGTGYWNGLTCRVELLRIDAQKLRLADRMDVIYTDARGVQVRARVLGPIQDDSADACVGVTLRENQAR